MLNLQKVTAAYGSAQILNGIDLSVNEGQIIALLGRNGVGKTTLLKSIMNIVTPTGGTINFKNSNITQLPTHQIAKSGIAYVPQGRGIFGKLSVEENLQMGLRACSDNKAKIPEFIYQKFPILFERRTQLAGTLSGGQAQQLAISRALCNRPSMLLLDEPSEGIQPNIVQQIGDFLKDLAKEQGIAILIVEQNIGLIQNACEHFHIMVKGEIAHSGTSNELDNETLLEKYLSI